jgi:membrane associated rhomboid family serine protease
MMTEESISMAWRTGYHRSFVLFGTRVPYELAVLGGAIIAASILGALLPLILKLGLFVPVLVLSGQAWRLVTWGFFALQPISLIFACLVLYWFGKDLAWTWGPWRLAAFYLGMTAASGALTCLFAFGWPDLRMTPFASPWPALSAMIIV